MARPSPAVAPRRQVPPWSCRRRRSTDARCSAPTWCGWRETPMQSARRSARSRPQRAGRLRRRSAQQPTEARSLLLCVLLEAGLARQHRARDLDHRHRAILARALEDAIRFLLRRAGAPHEDPLRALDRLAVLECATRGGGVLLRRAELARAAHGEAERRVEHAG